MKTTKRIRIAAYPVKLKDQRTGEILEDTVVLDMDWLKICGSDGLNISDDKHMIYRAYNLQGFEVLEVGKRSKAQLELDLEALYLQHRNDDSTDHVFESKGD